LLVYKCYDMYVWRVYAKYDKIDVG